MTLDTKLEYLTLTVQAMVIGLLIFRKFYKKLPLFFSYLIWLLLLTGATLALTGHYSDDALQKVFVIADIIDGAFMFCVLVELSMSVLSPIRSSLPSWSVFAVFVILAVAFAIIWPFAKPPGLATLTPASRLQVHFDTAMAVLPIVFFLALAGCSQWLSLSWRDRELQIGTGLGIFALASLSTTFFKMHVGAATDDARNTYHLFDQIQAGSYIVAMLYWLVSFAQKVRERREFTPQMENFLLALAGTARTTRVGMRDSRDFTRRNSRDFTKKD
ncbi:hypothetical protein [Occallatibacter savannae]|uniref:hypothetical protein n=1 Tax=Occallatibacter savannae TaxID=1002691 RepID=UPI000D69AE05|nr:hypothetical protein [Occallatibacter savannae]